MQDFGTNLEAWRREAKAQDDIYVDLISLSATIAVLTAVASPPHADGSGEPNFGNRVYGDCRYSGLLCTIV